MEPGQLSSNQEILQVVQAFVKSPAYIYIKDAFVSHTPDGDKGNKDSIELHHGMNLGTRFVFNKLEEVAKSRPIQKQQRRTPGGPDPDLSGEQ